MIWAKFTAKGRGGAAVSCRRDGSAPTPRGGVDDPGAQPECGDEAPGAGQGPAHEADESAALPADRPAGTGGPPCAPADHAPRRGRHDLGPDPCRPAIHPGVGAWAGG